MEIGRFFRRLFRRRRSREVKWFTRTQFLRESGYSYDGKFDDIEMWLTRLSDGAYVRIHYTDFDDDESLMIVYSSNDRIKRGERRVANVKNDTEFRNVVLLSDPECFAEYIRNERKRSKCQNLLGDSTKR